MSFGTINKRTIIPASLISYIPEQIQLTNQRLHDNVYFLTNQRPLFPNQTTLVHHSNESLKLKLYHIEHVFHLHKCNTMQTFHKLSPIYRETI